jgi:hypothetical protein
MKRIFPAIVIGAVLLGYIVGHATKPNPQTILTGHVDDLSLLPSAYAQTSGAEVLPFGFGEPELPALAPDAPPPTHWDIDDIRKAHTAIAERAVKALTQAGGGSTQAFGAAP